MNVAERLCDLLHGRLGIPEGLLAAENCGQPLTGPIFRMGGVELTYLFFEVEKAFQLHIDAKAITQGEFNSINGIVRIINKGLASRVV